MAPSDSAIIYRRREYTTGDRRLASFTVPYSDNYTYIVLAEFQVNKWVPFWSYKCLSSDYTEEFLLILQKELANVQNFYDGNPATVDQINDQVQGIAATL